MVKTEPMRIEDGCIIVSEQRAYDISLKQFKEPMDLVRWVYHLSEKRWVDREIIQEFINVVATHKGWRIQPIMNDKEPKFHPNQVVRILHSWAEDMPPRPIANVAWDEPWNCYTYAFPWALIRIEENMIEATGDPDMTTEDWIKGDKK